MVGHAYNPSTQEVEAAKSGIRGSSWLRETLPQKEQRLKSIKCWSFSGTPVSLSLPPDSGTTEGPGRVWEPETTGDHKEMVCQTQQGNCAYELTAVWQRAQAWQKPSVERGGGKDARLLAEELLVAGDSWEESQFALKTLLLGGRPCSIGRPHIQESYGQHNLYLVGFKKKKS